MRGYDQGVVKLGGVSCRTPDDYGVSYGSIKAGSGSGGGRNTLRREYQRLNHAGTGIEMVYFDYLSSSDLFDDAASRVTRLQHNAVTVAGYDDLGMS